MSLKLSKFLFFFIFIFSPLAFGTTEPWSYAIMESAIGLAVFFYLFWTITHKEKVYHVPGLVPLTLFLMVILLQLVPLPPFMVELLSPKTYAIHQTHMKITGIASWLPLSIHTKTTLSEFFRYSTYIMFYALTVQLLSQKRMFLATGLTIAIFGGLLAFSSILQFYLTEDMVLWFRHSPVNSITVGPYANHNHYAGLMEMIFPIVLGLFLFYRPRIGNTSLIKGIAEIFSQEKANIHILIGTSALLVVISIFVSLSRGAMISTCMALLLFTYLLLKRRISKGNTILILAVIMISALSIGWFGWDQIFERFAKLKNASGVVYESRLDFWKDSKEIIRDFPIIGTGMGTFSKIYPSYQSLTFGGFINHAHNDYLEILVEGGLIAFFLAASFLLTLFVKTYRVFLRRRDGFSVYLYMGSITAMLSILFHSFTDFNLRIGANGLWFFFCSGIAVCAANTGMRQKSPETRLSPIQFPGVKPAASLISFVMLISIILFNVSNLTGLFYFSNIRPFALRSTTPPDILKKYKQVAELASRFDPLHSEYLFAKANASLFLNNLDQAEQAYIASLNRSPMDSRHLNQFAIFLARQGHNDRATTAFEKSMSYDQTNAKYAFDNATWLFSQKKPDQGLDRMKQALRLDPKLIDQALTRMILSGLDKEKIKQAIPNDPGSSIAFAQFLFNTGDALDAVDRYIETLDLIEKQIFPKSMPLTQQNNSKRNQFLSIYWFFAKHNDMKNAMLVLDRAEKHLPMDPRIKIALGDFYFKQGIMYLAQNKYDHALLLDPENKHAQNMIKKINP